jgi:hypothetical protein
VTGGDVLMISHYSVLPKPIEGVRKAGVAFCLIFQRQRNEREPHNY